MSGPTEVTWQELPTRPPDRPVAGSRADPTVQVLAVDGGQSGIRVRHSSGTGVAELAGVSHQEGDTVASVVSAVVEGWRATGAAAVDRAVLGLTTAPGDEPSRRRLCGSVAAATGAREVWLADDAVTSHAGALSLGWGVSVAVGTGVACLAAPADADPQIVGGHGFLLGDEGGAYWVGREGIRAALRAADGRSVPTALAERASARFGGAADLAGRVHGLARPVNAIAAFATDVLEAAEDGDPVALGITEGAASELFSLLRAALSIAAPDGRSVPVALGGRLLGEGLLRGLLDAALAESLPTARPRSADGTPLDGALLLGAEPGLGRYRSLVHVRRAAA